MGAVVPSESLRERLVTEDDTHCYETQKSRPIDDIVP